MENATQSVRHDFRWDDVLRKGSSAEFTFEYNCDLRRLLPWSGLVDTKRSITEFGVIWVKVQPGTAVDEHYHDEEEAFLITSGRATLHLEGKQTNLSQGDVVYIPRNWRHQLINDGTADFTFIDIYWDMGGSGNPAAAGSPLTREDKL